MSIDISTLSRDELIVQLRSLVKQVDELKAASGAGGLGLESALSSAKRTNGTENVLKEREQKRRKVSEMAQQPDTEMELASDPAAIESQSGASNVPSPVRMKERREFNFSRHTRRPVALKLSYIGHDLHGFAMQPNTAAGTAGDRSGAPRLVSAHGNSAQLDTVESALFAALITAKLLDEKEERRKWAYGRCGRTDKGVSAFGQVISIRLRSALPAGAAPHVVPWDDESHLATTFFPSAPDEDDDESDQAAAVPVVPTDAECNNTSDPGTASPTQDVNASELDYPHLLNRLLPPTIRILGWSPVPPTFNARFSCRSRLYHYYVPHTPDLDVAAMQQAAEAFGAGVDRDFRNFCVPDKSLKKAGKEVRYTRTCLGVKVQQDPAPPAPAHAHPSSPLAPLPLLTISVHATSFLYHQVRCIVAVLLLVGRGLESPTLVERLLDPAEFHRGRPNFIIAPAEGLVLVGAGYDGWGITWRAGADAERNVARGVWEGWREGAVRTAVWGGLAREVGAGRVVTTVVGGVGGVDVGVAGGDQAWGPGEAGRVGFGAWREGGHGEGAKGAAGTGKGKKGKAYVGVLDRQRIPY
ncbi:pseudouridine synthase [Gonapodya prolifera JEL478]|uniref:Pseudouridine synthase n=1 Tax=Gonapodya prolifera (strain JEL478) TaxID=1344416 RepID=A0A139A012_GONPJ|nr:pseudouridine synthase [Gonapodya prolifera JEL478]|eukprot:KXS09875.1 pseudouridine synthase [Gonapodya prolifera JEL478]